MRRWIGVSFAAAFVAGAAALPSSATHERILLRIDGASRLEISGVENETAAMQFTWQPGPPLLEGDNLQLCWNGRFDRDQLTSSRQPNEICSSGGNGAQTGEVDGTTGRFVPLSAGRYEAVVRRLTPCEVDCDPPPPPHWNASNVVSFDVVDPCRLRLESFKTKGFHFPMQVDSPVTCSVAVQGELRVSGEDGSSIALESPKLSSIQYNTFELPWAPMLQLGSRGAQSDVRFSLRSRLAQFLTIAHTGAAMVIAVSPATVTMNHRRNVSRIHVHSGKVVALGMGDDFITRADMVGYCGRKRPTLACLSRIRYRYFTMKRGTSLRARVLRAGQKATFRKPRSVAKIVRR